MAQAAGKARPQFPVLVEGGGQGQGQVPLFESDEIVKTLFEKFGPPEKKESIPWQLRPGNFFGKVSLALSAAPRAASGRAAAFTFAEDEAGRAAAQEFAESRRALKPLTLWGYEPSPYVALVREKLTELVRSFFVFCLFVVVLFDLETSLSIARGRTFSLTHSFSFSLSFSLSLLPPTPPSTTGAPAPLQAGPSPRQEEARGDVRQVGADRGDGRGARGEVPSSVP